MMRWLMIPLFVLAVGCGSDTSEGNCGASVPESCPSSAPSYATDVAPLLQKYCVSCHSATGSEPGHLLDTQSGVAAAAEHVKSEVAGCSMPPSGSTAPTDAERETILAWLVCGAQDN